MKIIHTFYPILRNSVDKETILLMTLSALLAKKHYGNIHLYCDKNTQEIVKKIGIPYDTITTDLFDELEIKISGSSGLFSVPKIMVYKEQNEPFIHIDYDTFLFNKIDFNKEKFIYCTFFEGDKKITSFKEHHLGIYDTYIENTLKLRNILDVEIKDNIKFYKIANMSLFGGYHYNLIKDASNYSLNLIKKNIETFEKDYYNACVIEQLFITTKINLLIKEKSLNVKIKPLFKSIPFTMSSDNDDYPIKFYTNKISHNFINDEELFSYVNNNFNGFLHLNGFKNNIKILFLIKEYILFNFRQGKILVKNIDESFTEKTKFDELSEKYHNFILKKIKWYLL
jgi:hypothetical protein